MIKACPKESCWNYGKRYETYRHCPDCGTLMKPVEQCCEQESLGVVNSAYCSGCGKPKVLRFRQVIGTHVV